MPHQMLENSTVATFHFPLNLRKKFLDTHSLRFFFWTEKRTPTIKAPENHSLEHITWLRLDEAQTSSVMKKFNIKRKLVNRFTPTSNQDRISPYNINTISSRQVIRIEKNINHGIISWSNTKFSELTSFFFLTLKIVCS